MEIQSPFNFQTWLKDNQESLKPPVNNKMIWPESEFIVMVVAGPNQRSDFHIDPGEEIFYQIKGTLTLRLFIEKDFKDVLVHAGETFRLPPFVPHSPRRPADSLGVVLERKRREDEIDSLVWYCPNCKTQMYRQDFLLKNIEKDLPIVFDRFFGDPKLSTCKDCGFVQGRK